jgi:hypothetical protein
VGPFSIQRNLLTTCVAYGLKGIAGLSTSLAGTQNESYFLKK